jgi:hypothetical protein
MDLETISKLVAKHASPEALKLEKSLTEKGVQKRMYQSLKWGMICLILGMAVFTVAKTLALDKTFNLVGSFLVFLAMGLMGYSALSTMRMGASQPSKPGHAGSPGELPETEPTKKLTAARVPVPPGSVTERTTQLIKTETSSESPERL